VALTDIYSKGGEGGIDLAEKVVKATEEKQGSVNRIYDLEDSLETKIRKVAQNVYGADDIELSAEAKKQVEFFEKQGWGELPICIANTQYSLSDNTKLPGRPTVFTITIRELRASIGAGFIVALTGDIMTMPGLPKKPAALNMDVSDNGDALGLF